MPLNKEQIKACVYCVKKNHGIPPCQAPNMCAQKYQHPYIRFVSDTDVEWPCYFHADWDEIAPLLIGTIPETDAKGTKDPRYGQNDIFLTAYPDAISPSYLEGLMKETVRSATTSSAKGTKAQETVAAARTPACAGAVGYKTEGRKTTYGYFNEAMLYASHHGGRYQAWIDGLNSYNNCKGVLVSIDKEDPRKGGWGFITYGGGGVGATFGGAAGEILLKSPEGKTVKLVYGGIGVCESASLPKFKLAGKVREFEHSGAGGPTRFESGGDVYKNMEAFGSSEPEEKDLNGFCVWFSATAALGFGFGDKGANIGGGKDKTYLAILSLYPVRPTMLFAMHGNTAGLTLSVGVYLGYVHVLN